MGAKEANKHANQEDQGAGRGTVGKTAVVGVKDRKTGQVSAKVIANTEQGDLAGFCGRQYGPGSRGLHTDDAAAHHDLPFKHEAVKHSIEGVRARPRYTPTALRVFGRC